MMVKKTVIKTCYTLLLLFFTTQASNAEIQADVLAAAKKGDADAQYSVARSYELGKRVKSDNQKALFWYNKSANQGHLEASYRLGLIYYTGIGGYKINHEKAFKYLSQAAKGNHKRSQTHLAKMYENGDGVERSEVMSDYWYEQAFSSDIQSLDDFLKDRAGDEDEDESKPEPKVAKKSPVRVSEPVTRQNQKSSPHLASFPKSVLAKKWLQNGKPSIYLTSSTTKCKEKSGKIVCNSDKHKGKHSTGIYEYKIKSFISQTEPKNSIQILYRKLYTEVPKEYVSGYGDDTLDTAAKTLTLGWEKTTHKIPCEFETPDSILCRPVGKDAFYIKAR